MAVIGILLGILLNIFFLQSKNDLFITVSELREELWFAIILVIYGTIKNILDMKVKQDDVLTEQQLCKYIEKKFKKLYEDRKSTRLNSSHRSQSRMPSSA